MKITIVSPFFLPELNGLTISIFYRIKYLLKLGHEVQLVVPNYENVEQANILNSISNPKLMINKLSTIDSRTIKYETKFGKIMSKKSLKALNDFILKFRPDIIIVDNPHLFLLLSLYRFDFQFFRRINVKYYCIVHSNLSLFAKKLNKNIIALFLKFLIPYTCNKFMLTIFPSEYVRNSFPKIRKAKTIRFLGVDKSIFNKNIKVQNNYYTIISVSRLSKEKNIDFLYEVSKIVTKKYNVKWFFIGDGPLYGEFAGTDKIIFVGEVQHNELPNWYNQADIFINGCDFEAFGLTITEAMACGVVCIIPDRGGAVSNFRNKNSGLTYLANNPKSLISKIELILNNKKLSSEISQIAQKSVEDWEFTTKRLINELSNNE